MDIFNWNGAAGLPPLGDDENENASKRNDEPRQVKRPGVCPHCNQAVEEGFVYCWEYSIQLLRSAGALERLGANQLPMTAQAAREKAEHEAKAREQSAPMITLDLVDDRCYWCCLIKSDRIASDIGDDRILVVRPTEPDFVCMRHRARWMAWKDTRAAIAVMRDEGVSSREIADYYRYGYISVADIQHYYRQLLEEA